MKKRRRQKIIGLFNNERGATSILIIFMMIVLVTLGTFSITSANVNLKFGKKTVDINKIYYALDTAGESYLCDLDYALAKAQADAFAYMSDAAEILDENAEEVFNQAYMQFANEYVLVLKEKYPLSVVMPFTQDGEIKEIAAETSILSDIDENTSLAISAAIKPLSMKINKADGMITGHLAVGQKRFEIDSWQQIRTPFDYQAEPNIWDGMIVRR